MSFSKTVSVFAALASIFAAGATGWKLADSQKEVPLTPLDQKVMELEKKLQEVQEPQVTPEPVKLPEPIVQVTPQPVALPSPPPPVTTVEEIK
jgi:D-alanyl-D-alanine carboxypeptidase